MHEHFERPYNRTEAQREAQRCLQCVDAPCVQGCPARVDVRNFIREIATGNLRGASRFLRENNVLALSCAYICPTSRQCQEACSHTKLNFPITISRLQRYVAEQDLAFPRPAAQATGKRVAVIGSGPAGLSAAATLRRHGLAATIFEKRKTPGGMLANGIPSFRLPRDVVAREVEYVRKTGVEILAGTPAPRVDDLLKDFDAVFVGAGLWKAAAIPGPGFEGRTIPALDFLEAYACQGESAELRRQVAERTIVIGGGSVAMDAAGAALRLGARTVEMVCLEAPNEMPASPEEIRALWGEGLIFKNRMMPAEVVRENGRVSGLKAYSIRWKVPGQFVPQNAEKIEHTDVFIPGQAVIEAIGQRPEEALAQVLGDIETDGGYVVVDENMMTSREGVYAGGDIVNRGMTAVRAVMEGQKAAEAIAARLSGPQRG